MIHCVIHHHALLLPHLPTLPPPQSLSAPCALKRFLCVLDRFLLSSVPPLLSSSSTLFLLYLTLAPVHRDHRAHLNPLVVVEFSSWNASMFSTHCAVASSPAPYCSRPGTSSKFAAPQALTLCATSARRPTSSRPGSRRPSSSSMPEERFTMKCAVTRPRFTPPSPSLSSASLSSSSDAPAASSGSHSSSELSSRHALPPSVSVARVFGSLGAT